MRTIRALAIAAAVTAALPSFAAAQRGRQQFNDSWFWGIHGGGFSYSDYGNSVKQAPVVGLDWLITRTHGGLYVSGAQAFLNATTLTLHDPVAGPDSGLRVVDLQNLRKLDVAIMGFPGEHLRIHPYFGLGVTLAEVGKATPRGPFYNADQLAANQAVIEDARAAFAPLLMGGAQYRFRDVSAFGQLSLNPANKNFILYNGGSVNVSYEIGVRYNIGTSISRE